MLCNNTTNDIHDCNNFSKQQKDEKNKGRNTETLLQKSVKTEEPLENNENVNLDSSVLHHCIEIKEKDVKVEPEFDTFSDVLNSVMEHKPSGMVEFLEMQDVKIEELDKYDKEEDPIKTNEEQALWNSYVLYAKNGTSMTYLEFRTKLMGEYIEKYHLPDISTKGGRRSKALNPRRLIERHFLKSIPVTGSKSRPTKRCIVCCSKRDDAGKRIRRESRYWCSNCKVGLCLEPCFEIYHTKLNY